jgi:hypothetical protein
VKFSLPKFQLVLLLILAAFSAGVALTYWALTPSFYSWALTPLTLHAAPLRRLLFTTRMFFLYFLPAVTTGILWLVLSNRLKSRYMQQRWLRVTTWVRCHPRRALLLVAAMSTVISCYPVVFFGKSFLSPNNHRSAYLLYQRMPTVPGGIGIPQPTTQKEPIWERDVLQLAYIGSGEQGVAPRSYSCFSLGTSVSWHAIIILPHS